MPEERSLSELVTLPDALTAFKQHAWKCGDLLIADYSGIAAFLNQRIGRKTKKRREYVKPLTAYGLCLRFVNFGNAKQTRPHMAMKVSAFSEAVERAGLSFVPVEKSFEGQQVAIFASKSEARRARRLAARGIKRQAANKVPATPKKAKRIYSDALAKCKRMTPEEFYHSWEWKRLRYEMLKKYGAKCMLCGATPADGVRICVDHIKPRALYPELQLDPENMQVLCEACNMGKGRWDKTDWRKRGRGRSKA